MGYQTTASGVRVASGLVARGTKGASMPGRRLWPYEVPSTHEAVSDLIRKHSTNPRDLREQALEHHELSGARAILDLGCGFGYMAGEVARRAHPEAVVTGVDAQAANWRPFMRRVSDAGREGRFRRMRIERRLPFPDRSFDLVVCSYSLYFFPDVLPDVARVLVPDGSLLAVTHSEASVRDMLELVGADEHHSALLKMVRRFSAETGGPALAPWFDSVQRMDYVNSLRFQPGEIGGLLAYLRFKFRFVTDWPESEPELHRLTVRDIEERLTRGGTIELRKDDAVFWAAGPRSEGSE